MHRLARPQRRASVCPRHPQVERHRGGQHEPVGAASGGDPAVHSGQQRHHQPVLRPWFVGDVELNFAGGARGPAYEQVRHVAAEAVAAVVGAHRQQIGEHERPGRRGERRLQHERPFDVTAGDFRLAGRLDLPVTGLRRRATGRTPTGCRTAESSATRPIPRCSPARWSDGRRAERGQRSEYWTWSSPSSTSRHCRLARLPSDTNVTPQPS